MIDDSVLRAHRLSRYGAVGISPSRVVIPMDERMSLTRAGTFPATRERGPLEAVRLDLRVEPGECALLDQEIGQALPLGYEPSYHAM